MRNVDPKAPWSRPLSDFVDGCVAPSLAKFGFGQADLLTCWADIVGERVAGYSEPVRLQWGRRSAGDAAGPRPATLILRVEGGGALELQHMQETVIDRINRHLGWRCVGRLALRQAPLVGRTEPRRRPTPPSAASVSTATARASAIEHPALQAALARLGARVLDNR